MGVTATGVDADCSRCIRAWIASASALVTRRRIICLTIRVLGLDASLGAGD